MLTLNFQPFLGLSSKHLQTIIPSYRSPGKEPPWDSKFVELGGGDQLVCKVSTPLDWDRSGKSVVLVHGLGGSDSSGYMIRMARKLYAHGCRVVRVNLRGCGLGTGLSSSPYYAGASQDLLKVIDACKEEAPLSKIVIIGFSLGGNIALKLAGELGEKGPHFIERLIAVCAPIDLADTVRLISSREHYLYHSYYLKNFSRQIHQWVDHPVHSLYELDNTVIAPAWGYKNAEEYYRKCSSRVFLPDIRLSTDLLYAADDPFIELASLQGVALPSAVRAWATSKGGHMGFIGKTSPEHHGFWMDQQLLSWIGSINA